MGGIDTGQITPMDIGIIAALAMLIVWAVGTFMFDAPGWIHLLLSVGIFLLIWRIVARGEAPGSREKS